MSGGALADQTPTATAPSAPSRNWPCAADVEEAGLEGEADGQAGEDERCRVDERVDDRPFAARRSIPRMSAA